MISASLPVWALWLFAVIAALGVLVGVLVALPKLWSFLSKFVSTVDVIQTLPEKLDDIKSNAEASIKEVKSDLVTADKERREGFDRLEQKVDIYIGKLSDHLMLSNEKLLLLDKLDHRTQALMDVAGDIRYEVKNNGGGSTKDAVDRIEQGVRGLYAQPGEETSPGRQQPPHSE